MLIRTPDYYGQFRCLAGACPHSCCEKWEVVIDPDTAVCYSRTPGPLGERLRRAMQVDGEGDVCFPLRGGRCPFLDRENLCEIHRQLGEAATSLTCREHPRFTEDYGPFREITLSASCPAAGALLLGSREKLTFSQQETAEPGEPGDGWLPHLLPLRRRMLDLLRDRRAPLGARLWQLLALAADAQALLEEDRVEALPALAADWTPPDWTPPDSPGLFPGAWRLLAALEPLEPDWPAYLAAAERAENAGAAGNTAAEPLLERIAVYFAFRYLLKAVNDGDLLGRAAVCVLSTLAVERLAAVEGLAEALRRYSCEIEHSRENLEALQGAFWQGDALSLPRFYRTLTAR